MSILISSALTAWAEAPCPVPDDLALRDVALPVAKRAAAADGRLTILALGGTHGPGVEAGNPAATYPARLEAALTALLPAIQVSVVNAALARNTAADTPPSLSELLEKTGARLVIWGPGGRALTFRMDVRDYQNAIASGIEAVRKAGADLILLDTTYVPSSTRTALIEPYRERLRNAALANHLPLLRRHDLMLRWSKNGTLNLDAREPEEQRRVTERLFACVAWSLAGPIAAALADPAADVPTQR